MAFRAVYIIDHRAQFEKSANAVLFRRSFPVVEKKCANFYKENYSKIPLHFPDLIVEELQLYRSDKFVEKLDSCTIPRTQPVYGLLDKSVYPVVAFEKDGLVYACVVFDEKIEVDHEPHEIFKSSGVIAAFEMLENMAMYLGKYDHEINMDEKRSGLNKYVSTGFPFGIPIEIDINICFAMISSCTGGTMPKLKGPSWRPIGFKGKHLLQFEIQEEARALQFDRSSLQDTCEVFGQVICKADVEESPEISFNLLATLESLVLNQMAYHFCVQLVDDEITPIMKGDKKLTESNIDYGSRRVRFIPPYDSFVLCRYVVKMNKGDFPVQAFYQMKGDAQNVRVMIQLKLSEKMKNNFEYFNVDIPFFNRGSIADVKCSTTSALLKVTSDKTTLVWAIGSKLPGKSNDISLEASVNFEGPILRRDELLTGLNSYIDISWKIHDYSYSGIKIDSKSVELYPHNRIKVVNNSCFKSAEYKVWNTHGQVMRPAFRDPHESKTVYIPDESWK